MILGKFVKTPGERKRYTVDYSQWLDTGELVASVTYEVIPAQVGGLVVNGSAVGTPATGISFFVDDGIAANAYTVVVTIVTSGGQIKQDEIKFSVRAISGSIVVI